MNEKEFVESIKDLNIDVNEEILKKLNKYFELMIEYNNHTNITAITKKEDVYLKHFYDSLTLGKAIDLKIIKSMCDVDSDTKFPGVVIAIFFPNIKIDLIESITKKTKFLDNIKKELNLVNINIINERVEDYCQKNKEKYDLVTCRALSKLNVISELCIPLVKINGYFIAMKGDAQEETKNIKFLNVLGSTLEKTNVFNLPKENIKRSLIVIKKQRKTNIMFPRKYNLIKQRPLE